MVKLIYDIGAHRGDDTAFYLAKGAKVIAVEANPSAARDLRTRFADEIKDGRLVVEEVAITDREGCITLYINERCDLWTSTSETWAAQDGGGVLPVTVRATTLAALIAKHGRPYYVKIDIEGQDKTALQSLRGAMGPQFVSVEEWGRGTISALRCAGYDRFSIRPQADKSWCKESGIEGPVTGLKFDHWSSGLFGLEVPDWLPFDEAERVFNSTVRGETGQMICAPGEFFDVHATKKETLHGDHR